MPLIVYGIKNCSTVKSAIDWLKKNRIDFSFHDFKSKGVTEAKLTAWSSQVGWESLVNRRGTTWRQLPSETQGEIKDLAAAITLMTAKTSVIKRPVLESEGKVLALGFDPDLYARTFSGHP